MGRRIGPGSGALVLLVGAAAIGTAQASPRYTVQTVQFPTDPTFTQLLGINDQGLIVGYHGAAVNKGFTLTLPGTFADTNFPGSAQTQVTGVSGAAGNTNKVGFYVDTAGATHGFIAIPGLPGIGPFFNVDQPGTAFDQVLGISNIGNRIAGYSSADPAGATLQRAYVGTAGLFGNTFTDINGLLPANQDSQATGINSSGAAVGFYLPASGPNTSLGFQDVGGTISTLDPFGSPNTQALGIAGSGEIVGFYTDANGVQHGYIDIGGVFSSFDPPGSVSTTINGVNDLGQLVGFFTDANDNVIGFVATPAAIAEPASLALLGAGLLGIAGVRRRQRGSGRSRYAAPRPPIQISGRASAGSFREVTHGVGPTHAGLRLNLLSRIGRSHARWSSGAQPSVQEAGTMARIILRSFRLPMLLGTAALLLGGAASARATVINGSSLAFGESVAPGIAITSGPLPLASGAAPAPYNTTNLLLSANVPNVLTTGLLTTSIRSDVDGGAGLKTTASFATVNRLSLVLGSLTVGLTSISSQASVSGDYGALTAAGRTAVSGLTINGVPIVLATMPANDVLLSAPGLTVTLNEQVAGGNGIGSRSLQVRGLDIALNGFADGTNLLSGDIVIAKSTAREAAAQSLTPVPEPASLAIFGLSLGALALIRRRRGRIFLRLRPESE